MATVTSTYAGIWRALTRLCCEISWPVPPINTPGVEVSFAGWGEGLEPAEACLIVGNIGPGEATQEWATTALGRNESLIAEVQIKTALQGRDADQTLDRLEELTAVFEAMIVSNTRQGFQPEEVTARPWWWGVTSSSFLVVPVIAGGFAGFAKYEISAQARIGGI